MQRVLWLYAVCYLQDPDEPLQLMELEIPPTKTSTEVGDLQPDTAYAVRVAALMRTTRGKLSEPALRARTDGGVPHRGTLAARFAPDAHDGDKEDGSRPAASPLSVSWSSPPGNRIILGYRLLVGARDDVPQVFQFGPADRGATVLKLGMQMAICLLIYWVR